jgi:hypothetical protein
MSKVPRVLKDFPKLNQLCSLLVALEHSHSHLPAIDVKNLIALASLMADDICDLANEEFEEDKNA